MGIDDLFGMNVKVARENGRCRACHETQGGSIRAGGGVRSDGRRL